MRELEALAARVPGNNYEFTQPIEMRFNELISGVRSDVAVKVYGDDLTTLLALGEEIEATLVAASPGGADVALEQMTGLPMLTVAAAPRARSRATASTSPTCRTSSRRRSAARPSARSSRATGASIS